jgi:queuine tRNA-ribosyltransferase
MFRVVDISRTGLRRGELQTPHGLLKTPFFMPDATRGFVKLTGNEELRRSGTAALVVNTFHLYLQPGLKVIAQAGGLHKFMAWPGPLLSDSGGYQVFSLIHRQRSAGRISDEKVSFRSPLDGSRHELTPEKSIQIQFALGTDMMVCLDDCPPNEFSRSQLETAVARTIAWAKRCRREYDRQLKKRYLPNRRRPLLFAVIQGGVELDLREHCTRELVKIGFDGYGFGARPVDKDGRFLESVLQKTAAFIPSDSLRFALGIGTPEDIRRCALMGWDMFDCVIPTREGRHGKLFLNKQTKRSEPGKSPRKKSLAQRSQPTIFQTININNARFAKDFAPINKWSRLPELKNSSFAYLHHLFRLDEALGQKLASLNNLEFYQGLLENLRRY